VAPSRQTARKIGLWTGQSLALAAALAIGADTPRDTRRPVPSAAAQAEAEKLIRGIYQVDYARRRPVDQQALATKLHAEGHKTRDDWTGRFVLFREARELAIAAADAVLAMEAVDAMAKDFAVDPLPAKVDVVQRVAKVTTTPAGNRDLAEIAVGLIAHAIEKNELDLAPRLCDVAESCAARSASPNLRKQIEAKTQTARLVEKESSLVRPALAVLQDRPDDPSANLVVGRFRCLVKGDWDAGVLLLARGSDERLRRVARLDLRKPVNPPDQVEVGDGWWDLAETERGPARTNLQRRAGHWYKMAAPKLSGLSQAKVDSRLRQIAEIIADQPDERSRPVGEVLRMTGHANELTSVAVTPDGRRVVSASHDRTARAWDTSTGREVARFTGHNNVVWGVAISPDGRTAATAGADKSVRLWEVETGREVGRFDGHTNDVCGVTYLPDGKRLASGSADMTARLWGLEPRKELRRFLGHSANVHRLAVSPDKRLLATSGYDKTVKIWNLQSGRQVGNLTGHNGQVFELSFSLDGHRVYAGGRDDTWRVWDLDTGKELRSGAGGEALALSPDGKRLVTGGKDAALRLVDAITGRELAKFAGHSGELRSVAFFADGRRVVSGAVDKTVRIWRLP
jgi:hypothetical protein